MQSRPFEHSSLPRTRDAAIQYCIQNAAQRGRFTQGFELHDDGLYESTGRIGGTTRLNVISLDGKVKQLTDLGTTVFGEGLTILRDEVFQLTWQEHAVFVYDLSGKLKRKMHNPRDGWGLSNDGTNLIFSDGGPSFYYADPRTFAIRKAVRIRMNRPGEVEGLNELELVNGKLFGNIFTTRDIVRIDLKRGASMVSPTLAYSGRR